MVKESGREAKDKDEQEKQRVAPPLMAEERQSAMT
jgi:hypothetical protein